MPLILPIIPPLVTTWSPFFSDASIAACSRCRFCCGRINMNQKTMNITTIRIIDGAIGNSLKKP